MTTRAAISLGSNIDPAKHLQAAMTELADSNAIKVLATSSVYSSEAVGPAGQPSFLNAAMVVETSLDAGSLRAELRRLESELGRVRTNDKFAPRKIDLDLVLYDDVMAQFEGWELPAPDLELPHVVVPLAEIAPSWVIPGRDKKVSQLAAKADPSAVRRVEAEAEERRSSA